MVGAMGDPRGTPCRAAVLSPAEMGERAGAVAALLEALADPRRLAIACLVAEGRCSLAEFEAKLDIDRSTLSEELALLQELGVVEPCRISRRISYGLAATGAGRLAAAICALFCAASGP